MYLCYRVDNQTNFTHVYPDQKPKSCNFLYKMDGLKKYIKQLIFTFSLLSLAVWISSSPGFITKLPSAHSVDIYNIKACHLINWSYLCLGIGIIFLERCMYVCDSI